MYDNTNTGALFKNSKKETEKHPDYTGTIDVDGTEYRLAAWIRTSKAGTKYMSLAVSNQEQAAKKPQKAQEASGAFSDDVPFAPYLKGSV